MTPPHAFGAWERSMTAGGGADLWPLAEAKLAAPRQGSELVDRPRIMQTLDAGADAALTLVAAPPGFGKSTAVRAWCATRGELLLDGVVSVAEPVG